MEIVPPEFNTLMADTFKIRVGAVVLDNQNRLLLARQNKRPFWVLPGGTLENGESIGECAVREVKEESNLDIKLGPLLYVSDFFAPDGRQVLDLIFYGQLLGGTLQRETTQNIDEIGFFPYQDVVSMPTKPENVFKKILPEWQSQKWSNGEYIPPGP